MKTFEDLKEWQNHRAALQGAVGFVPTMGALHEGHLALVEQSRQENEITVVSIFVNPTQFNNSEDLQKYPRTLESDLALLKDVEYVLLPTFAQIYPDQYRYKISENEFSKKLCGASRPGHFDGVLTVVMKLFQLVQPTRAYFGEKDFQQLELIRGMAEAFFLPLEIVACPTVREESGLAMSSRNMRLSEPGKTLASRLNQILRESPSSQHAADLLKKAGFEVDYVEDINHRRFAAAWLENVRLIDNVVWESR